MNVITPVDNTNNIRMADFVRVTSRTNINATAMVNGTEYTIRTIGTTDFTFTVNKNDLNKALTILNEKVKNHVGAKEVNGNDKIAKVSIVGVGMRSHVGVASQMFRTLSEEGINIGMISTSEIKISVLIDEKYLELAVRALHKAFGLDA